MLAVGRKAGIDFSVPVGTQLLFMNHRLLDLLRRPEDTSARDTPDPGALFRADPGRDPQGLRRTAT